jgi:hypothetical protein
MVRYLIAWILLPAAGLVAQTESPEPVPLLNESRVKYKTADITRPRPSVVAPPAASTQATPGQPPSDATVLFNGQDLSAWMEFNPRGADDPSKPPKWIIQDRYTLAAGNNIQTREKFADCHFHVEWASPEEIIGDGQMRGNSGLAFGEHGEIQILDSYQNDTYPDGQAAAIYGVLPPLVNASRKPGEWQTYDVFYTAPVFSNGIKIRSATYTVLHNSLPVHLHVPVKGDDVACHIRFLPHGGKVRFRNIWVRPLHRYDENAAPVNSSSKINPK